MEKKYVLITPARNEEKFIEKTINSVCSQTILPVRWIIVNDGSTDRTDEIVRAYLNKYDFITSVSLPESGRPNFGSKVRAINEGYKLLANTEFNFIGNLDADISFNPLYYQSILDEFAKNKKLGIAGGIVQEFVGGKYVEQRISNNSVAGGIQFFRRECYEAIGGYIPMKHGGIDAAAEIIARMKGWEVKTLKVYKVLHPRRVSTGKNTIIKTRFYQGTTNYLLGYHPLFQISSISFRVFDRPFLFGSLSTMCGYLWAYYRKYNRKIPKEAVQFLQAEQLDRLKLMFYFWR